MLFDEVGPAHDVYLLRGGWVGVGDELLSVGCRGLQDAHGLLEAGVACGDGGPGERLVEWKVVYDHVGGVGEVGDGVGVAVHGCLRVLQTACVVDWHVRDQGNVGVTNEGVAGLVVLAAVLGLDQGFGKV